MDILNKVFNYMPTPILLYHQIALGNDPLQIKVTPQSFERQMKYLFERGFMTVTLDGPIDAFDKSEVPAKKRVAITFDDGYMDNYTIAFPILQKYGFTATIFLIADFMGKVTTWPGDAEPKRFMDWSQAEEMSRYGIFFGSHSSTHPDLKNVDDATLFKEISESRQKIEAALGQPVKHFSYPFGSCDQRVIAQVRQAGYQSACSIWQSDNSQFSFKRFVIATERFWEFKLKAGLWGPAIREFANKFR